MSSPFCPFLQKKYAEKQKKLPPGREPGASFADGKIYICHLSGKKFADGKLKICNRQVRRWPSAKFMSDKWQNLN
ncbi:MAG TPA: hypothetical protein IAA30_06945 [Candidatus Treponema faecavium]|nr:hypothetical protein [Candidatus Treponema faecavium]